MKQLKSSEYIPIDISWSEMITYIERATGIHPILISTILDAEEMFLRTKGVIVD